VTEETETESAEEDRSDDEKKGSKRNVSGWIFIMLLMVAGGIYVAYRVKGSNNSFKKLISEKKDGLINKGGQRKQAARDNVDGGLEAGSDEENEEDIK
jgi:flagellar basal body-associated protein FliL